MDWTPYIPYAIPATIFACAAVAKVAGDLSMQAEAKHASRVAQVERAVARLAGGIGANLVDAKAAGTAADVLTALKGAAVAQSADYLLGAMPTKLQQVGATKDRLIAMLNGEVGNKTLAATAVAAGPALLSGAATLLAQATPSLVVATEAAAPAPTAAS